MWQYKQVVEDVHIFFNDWSDDYDFDKNPLKK